MEGIKVAIVDSGVDAGRAVVPLRVAPVRFGPTTPLQDGHGMVVAGLVAGGEREDGGPTGISPGAEIVDVRVYDDTYADGTGGIPPENVVAALDWLTQHAEDEGIGVVVTAFDLPDSPALRRSVAALSERDVVIVAGSGNRPGEEGQDGFEEYGEQRPGEDARDQVFPAGYLDDVLAVGATAEGVPVEGDQVSDASRSVLLSSAIDVAVPTYGAISLAGNGSTCVVDSVATSWAAGIGGGVVALVRSAYPDENADQIEARLLATADGAVGSPTRATGAGVLQPVEALTQELAPTRRGRRSTTCPVRSRSRSGSPPRGPPPTLSPAPSPTRAGGGWSAAPPSSSPSSPVPSSPAAGRAERWGCVNPGSGSAPPAPDCTGPGPDARPGHAPGRTNGTGRGRPAPLGSGGG